MQTIETTVYEYDELSDAAKEKAREWYASCGDTVDFDGALEDIETCANLLGITFYDNSRYLERGRGRTVSYSIGDRGDYFSFSGNYEYRRGAAAAVKAYAPKDTYLHDIARRLVNLQKPAFYGISATIRLDIMLDSVHVYPEHSARDITGAEEEELDDIIYSFREWARCQLTREYEYQYSEECIAENIRINEYTFTAEGKRF